MDPSQKAAEPLKPVSTAAFVRQMREPDQESIASTSPEAAENRQRAASEISMIFELKDNRAFQWFVKEFIDSEYQKAFDKLRIPALRQAANPATGEPAESLELIQATYVALRAVKVGIIEREIAHRELIDPADEEIPRLRRLLAGL